MAIRIPWDKYEAIILLEAWFQVKAGAPKLQMVNLVSYQLRTKALNQGIEIDDIFRNTNGISFQLMSMATAYEQQNMGKAASKLFLEIADLYRNDYDVYQNLKKEAVKMIEYTSKSKDDFIEYVTKKHIGNASDILSAIDSMENFAISTKALTHSIYDDLTLDVISILRKNVVKHKFFIVRYKKCLPFAEIGLQLLEDYMKTLSASDSTVATDTSTFNITESQYIRKDKEDFYRWLLTQGIADNTARQYVKAVRNAEKFAEDHNLEHTELYTETHNTAETTAIELFGNADFIRFNKEKHNRYSDGIVMLMKFYGIELKDSCCKENSDNRSYKGNDGFVLWMTEGAHLCIATARSYRSAINTCDLYAQTHSLYSGSITACSSYNEFILMYTALMEDNGFHKTSEEKHNYLIAALNKYRDYMTVINNGDMVITKISLSPVANNNTISAELAKRCGTILSEEFDEGYRIGDYIHRMRFLSEYEERYGEEINENLDDLLKSVGQIREGRVFYSDKTENTLLSDIYENVRNAFNNGATAVYYECLYDEYSEQLATEMNIYSADTLRTAIQSNADFLKEYHTMKSYITKYGVEADSNKEIRKVLQSYHVPVTFEEIQARVKHIPLYKIKQALVQIPEAAYIDEGTYFYAPNFYISSEEKMALSHAMHSTLSTKGFLVAKDLRDIFRNACPSSAMDSEQYKDLSIRNILKVLLKDEFEFSSSTITEKGKTLDYGRIFQNYAAERERVSLNELLELKKELGLPVIYWDSIFGEMIRISATEMVRKGTVKFDVTAVDCVLEEMYPDEYTPLKDVTLFLNLPPASVRWNGFLLESFLREYSEKFRLVQLSIAQDDYFGVMLKSTSALESYADVAADMLARNHSWSDEKSALELLKDMKFQQRAKNSNISAIIKAAKQKRLNID